LHPPYDGALLDFELANVCLTKIKRQPNQREALRAAFRLAHRLKVETVAVATPRCWIWPRQPA
jgi:hypothetical protein